MSKKMIYFIAFVMIIHYLVNFLSFGGSILANLIVFANAPGIKIIMPISAIIEIVILYYIYKRSKSASLIYGISKGILGVFTIVVTLATLSKFNQNQIILMSLYSLTSILIAYLILIKVRSKNIVR